MATIQVSCPDCHSTQVIKAGKQPNGTQRYRCQNPTCERTIFQLTHVASGRLPETQRQIVEMTLNGSGIRDTARVLQVSPVTVLRVLKKRTQLKRGQSRGAGHLNVRGHGRTAGQGEGGRSRRNVVLCR